MLTPTAITTVGAAVLEALVPSVDEEIDTFEFDETAAGEQVVTTITVTDRSFINAFWLDMSNVTQDVTFRVYHQVDGSNYREFQENSWKTTFDDGVLISGFVANGNVRLTMQCSGGGVGSVDVPYTVM